MTESNKDEIMDSIDISKICQEIDYEYAERPGSKFRKNNIHFRLESFVGKGSFSYCFAYQIIGSEEKVVAKVSAIYNDKENQPSDVEDQKKKWLNEVNIMKKLDHTNIIKIRWTKETQSIRYIFMEYMPTNLMKEYCVHSKMSIARVRNLMRGILNGLKYLHSLNIVHRDIKLSNILMSSDENVKICDFNISVLLPKGCTTIKTDRVQGTLKYVAPEVLDKYVLSTKADMWSAGVIMFTLIVGDFPFIGDNNTEIFFRIKNCLFDFSKLRKLRKGGYAADNCLQRFFVMNPNDRFTAIDALGDPFFNEGYREIRPHEIKHIISTQKDIQAFCLQDLDNILRINMTNKTTPHHQMVESSTTIWVLGYLTYVLNIGLAYTLSNGRMGMLFKDGCSVSTMPSGESIDKVSCDAFGNVAYSTSHFDIKKEFLYILYKELVAIHLNNSHNNAGSNNNKSLVNGFFYNKNISIFLFTNSSYQINVVTKLYELPIAMLIDSNNVYLYDHQEYFRYTRDSLPKRLRSVIKEVIIILKE